MGSGEKPFTFNGHPLRSTIIDGQPWFVAADACSILAMSLASGTGVWLNKLDPDERMLASRKDHPTLLVGSRAPSLTLISRPGLFKLIQRSNKPEAKAFDRWVRHEVLPAIMDHGGYVVEKATNFRRSAIETMAPEWRCPQTCRKMLFPMGFSCDAN